MPLTTAELQYNKILSILKPYIDKNMFIVKNSINDNLGSKGIVAGKFTWNVSKDKLNVYIGFDKNDSVIIVPHKDRLAEEQCLFLVQKPIGKPFKILKYVKVMKYLGKTSIDISLGQVDVHNYYVRLPKQRKKDTWLRIRDILEVTKEEPITVNGLFATSDEGQETIINMFPDFARYDISNT